jgi:hypothetical protein
MANSPIGITFIPTEENQALGPQRNALEGSGGSDLAQAFKILSLRLPQVLGARAIGSPRVLSGGGSAALPPAFNPNAAVFKALINAMMGGGEYGRFLGNEPSPVAPPSASATPWAIPAPNFKVNQPTREALPFARAYDTPSSVPSDLESGSLTERRRI